MSTLDEFAEQERERDAAHELTVVRRELAIAKNQLTAARIEADEVAQLLARFGHFDSAHAVTPDWVTHHVSGGKKHHATAVLMLSDLHLDEVVNHAEMDGINEYNRAIAEVRLHRIVESTV